jgi:hypothetical protein
MEHRTAPNNKIKSRSEKPTKQTTLSNWRKLGKSMPLCQPHLLHKQPLQLHRQTKNKTDASLYRILKTPALCGIFFAQNKAKPTKNHDKKQPKYAKKQNNNATY